MLFDVDIIIQYMDITTKPNDFIRIKDRIQTEINRLIESIVILNRSDINLVLNQIVDIFQERWKSIQSIPQSSSTERSKSKDVAVGRKLKRLPGGGKKVARFASPAGKHTGYLIENMVGDLFEFDDAEVYRIAKSRQGTEIDATVINFADYYRAYPEYFNDWVKDSGVEGGLYELTNNNATKLTKELMLLLNNKLDKILGK